MKKDDGFKMISFDQAWFYVMENVCNNDRGKKSLCIICFIHLLYFRLLSSPRYEIQPFPGSGSVPKSIEQEHAGMSREGSGHDQTGDGE